MIVSGGPSTKSFHLQRPLRCVVACFAFCALTAQALTLTGVQSRKTHLSVVGVLDLPIDTTLPMTGNVTVEPRVIGSGHTIVFQFDGPITSTGTLAVVDNTLTTVPGATATISVNDVLVNLTALPDNKRVRITLSNVNGIGLNAIVSVGFLVGDVNNSL